MVELVTCADEALPADFECQVLAAHRIEWPEGYVGKNRLRDWVQPPRFPPTHFLLGYVGATRKRLEHAGGRTRPTA